MACGGAAPDDLLTSDRRERADKRGPQGPMRADEASGAAGAVLTSCLAKPGSTLPYALPMRMPEAKTSAPPRITWKADMRKLISKYR